ncbi:MAG: CHRD domain-containing protein [Ignavibacteriaceae bacterium]
MKYLVFFASILILLFFGFSYKEVKPENNQLNKQSSAENLIKSSTNFKAHLSGSEEVPPVKTKAHGEAAFKLSKDGKSIHYKITVANLEDVNMAHIHQGAAGADGPIVVWLYPGPGTPSAKLIPGKTNGVLAEGTITEANLTGPLADSSMSSLLKDIKSGNAYVNVHTKQNPAGEIRGQIK